MSNFAERLKELRESQGLTLEQFGNMLCLSKSAINMYERGEREPSFKILERIADYCNVDIDFLIRGSHSKQEEVKKVTKEEQRLLQYKKREELAAEIARKFEGYTLSEASFILRLVQDELQKRVVIIFDN